MITGTRITSDVIEKNGEELIRVLTSKTEIPETH